jgi:N-acetylneuraminic acid mutarotase
MKTHILLIILYVLIVSANGGWQAKKSMPGVRTGASIVLMDSVFYIIGGKDDSEFLSDILVYDPEKDSWDENSIPAMITPRADAAVVVYDDDIFVIGGRNKKGSCNEVEVFDTESGDWSVKRTLRGPRSGLTALVWKDTLLIFGGIDSDGNYIDRIEWYDADNNKWIKLSPKMAPPRAGMFSFLTNGHVFFTGGFYFSPLSSSSVLSVSGEWEDGPEMTIARGDGATAMQGDSVYFIGGESMDGTTDIIELYDMNSGLLTHLTELPAPRAGLCAAIWKDSLYIFGGYGLHSTDLYSEVMVYHPTITTISKYFDHQEIPQNFTNIRNYPNPFNNSTTFELTLTREDHVELKIYDVRGRRITTLINKKLALGTHTSNWNIADNGAYEMATGLYIAVLKTTTEQLMSKLLYVK